MLEPNTAELISCQISQATCQSLAKLPRRHDALEEADSGQRTSSAGSESLPLSASSPDERRTAPGRADRISRCCFTALVTHRSSREHRCHSTRIVTSCSRWLRTTSASSSSPSKTCNVSKTSSKTLRMGGLVMPKGGLSNSSKTRSSTSGPPPIYSRKPVPGSRSHPRRPAFPAGGRRPSRSRRGVGALHAAVADQLLVLAFRHVRAAAHRPPAHSPAHCGRLHS